MVAIHNQQARRSLLTALSRFFFGLLSAVLPKGLYARALIIIIAR